jgi:hypothetical protein
MAAEFLAGIAEMAASLRPPGFGSPGEALSFAAANRARRRVVLESDLWDRIWAWLLAPPDAAEITAWENEADAPLQRFAGGWTLRVALRPLEKGIVITIPDGQITPDTPGYIDAAVRDYYAPSRRQDQPAAAPASPGVYFIQCQTTHRIKIGFSCNPAARFKTLQTAAAGELRWLGFLPGDRSVERDLHARFSKARVNREWFRAAPDVLRYIEGLR